MCPSCLQHAEGQSRGPQVFAGQLPDVSFPDLLTRLGEEARLGGSYFLCQQDDVMRIAKALEQVRARSRATASCCRALRVLHFCWQSKAARLLRVHAIVHDCSVQGLHPLHIQLSHALCATAMVTH